MFLIGPLLVLQRHILHIVPVGVKETGTGMYRNIRILPSWLLACVMLSISVVASLPSLPWLWVLLLVRGCSGRAMLSLRVPRASELGWWSRAHGWKLFKQRQKLL